MLHAHRWLGNAALVMVLGACGESATEPAPITVTGTWSGAVDGQTLRLVLSEGAGGAVTGSGTWTYPGDEGIPLTVSSGTHVSPNVSLVLVARGYEDSSLVGNVNASFINGRLNGSGFVNDPIVLSRQ